MDHGHFAVMANFDLQGETAELARGLSVGAQLSVNLSAETATALGLADDSSNLWLRWRPPGWANGEGLVLTLLPLTADRLYLGYEFPMTVSLAQSAWHGPETGARLSFLRGPASAFVAVKSALVSNEARHEDERRFTFFFGGGFDLLSHLSIEAEGAHADDGLNPEPFVLGTPLLSWSVAGRVRYHRGSPIGPPTDFDRYRNDPAVWENLLRPETYDGRLSASLGAEVLYVLQGGLASVNPGESVASPQPATGVAVEGRLKWNRTRIFLRGQLRTLSLLFADQPGFPVLRALPDAAQRSSALSATVAVDHHFDVAHLTPGLRFELTRPAALSLESSPLGPETYVFDDAGTFTVLPSDQSPLPTFRIAATARADLGPLSALGEAFYTHDGNRTTFRDNNEGLSEIVSDDPSTYGFDVLIQARF